jgi:hypothetical protein
MLGSLEQYLLEPLYLLVIKKRFCGRLNAGEGSDSREAVETVASSHAEKPLIA